MPEVTGAASSADVAARLADATCAIVLEPGATQAAVAGCPCPVSGDIVLVVGPEGGISPAEMAAFTAAGAIPARLGDSVLRTSTAGAVAAAVLMTATGRW